MKKILCLLALLVTISVSSIETKAQNSDAYNKAVAEYLAASNAKNTVAATLVQTYNSMNLPITNMNEMVSALLDAIWEPYIDECAKVMSRYLSVDEINQITDFYKSPAGKKFAEVSPEMTQELTAIMMKPEILNKMQVVMLQYLNN